MTEPMSSVQPSSPASSSASNDGCGTFANFRVIGRCGCALIRLIQSAYAMLEHAVPATAQSFIPTSSCVCCVAWVPALTSLILGASALETASKPRPSDPASLNVASTDGIAAAAAVAVVVSRPALLPGYPDAARRGM